ncbi:hypothetical protein BC332_25658 [Capsicum chinense]|nr:hypothetical protein BC332_25658 [Capsicum chinense]
MIVTSMPLEEKFSDPVLKTFLKLILLIHKGCKRNRKCSIQAVGVGSFNTYHYETSDARQDSEIANAKAKLPTIAMTSANWCLYSLFMEKEVDEDALGGTQLFFVAYVIKMLYQFDFMNWLLLAKPSVSKAKMSIVDILDNSKFLAKNEVFEIPTNWGDLLLMDGNRLLYSSGILFLHVVDAEAKLPTVAMKLEDWCLGSFFIEKEVNEDALGGTQLFFIAYVSKMLYQFDFTSWRLLAKPPVSKAKMSIVDILDNSKFLDKNEVFEITTNWGDLLLKDGNRLLHIIKFFILGYTLGVHICNWGDITQVLWTFFDKVELVLKSRGVEFEGLPSWGKSEWSRINVVTMNKQQIVPWNGSEGSSGHFYGKNSFLRGFGRLEAMGYTSNLSEVSFEDSSLEFVLEEKILHVLFDPGGKYLRDTDYPYHYMTCMKSDKYLTTLRRELVSQTYDGASLKWLFVSCVDCQCYFCLNVCSGELNEEDNQDNVGSCNHAIKNNDATEIEIVDLRLYSQLTILDIKDTIPKLMGHDDLPCKGRKLETEFSDKLFDIKLEQHSFTACCGALTTTSSPPHALGLYNSNWVDTGKVFWAFLDWIKSDAEAKLPTVAMKSVDCNQHPSSEEVLLQVKVLAEAASLSYKGGNKLLNNHVFLKHHGFKSSGTNIGESDGSHRMYGHITNVKEVPSEVPDLDLIFTPGDQTVGQTEFYQRPKVSAPPLVFHYCSNDASLDIVIPDWSFLGYDNYLKEQRLSPQTFIPLQSICIKPIVERLRTLGRTTKLVFDVIQTSEVLFFNAPNLVPRTLHGAHDLEILGDFIRLYIDETQAVTLVETTPRGKGLKEKQLDKIRHQEAHSRVDKPTKKKFGLNFTRLLVEVKVGAELLDEIKFKNKIGIAITQVVTYDWMPTTCSHCHKYGNEKQNCRKLLPKEQGKNVDLNNSESESDIEEGENMAASSKDKKSNKNGEARKDITHGGSSILPAGGDRTKDT